MKPNRRSDSSLHNEVADALDQFRWFVLGILTLPSDGQPSPDRHDRQERRQQLETIFVALMSGLAKFAKVPPDKLVYFQSDEYWPQYDLHHVVFLLGRKGLEKYTAWEISEFLTDKAVRVDIPIAVEPCETWHDAVGYATRKRFERDEDGHQQTIPLNFSVSDGFADLFGSPSGLRPQAK